MNRKMYLIVAMAENRGIGYQGKIPWHLKKDMSLFTFLTKTTENPAMRNAVIMGRKTWESIPEKNKPLSGRINIVLSRGDPVIGNETYITKSLEDALKLLEDPVIGNELEDVWIIGGSQIYKEAMEHPNCQRIYVTCIKKDFPCDVFMPPIDSNKFQKISDPRVPTEEQEENGINFSFEVYERKRDVN